MSAQSNGHGALPRDEDGMHRDEERHHPPLRRGAIRALVQDFGPLWFTWCMNAGIISIILHQLPYQFPGLKVISTLFFVFDLALYVVFSIIFLARFAWFRRAAYDEIANDLVEITMLGCWAIAFLTLTSLVALICSTAGWGGHAFTLVGYVMFWIGAVWNLLILIGVFTLLIRRHEASDRRIPFTIIIPAVSTSTVAVVGGLVAGESHGISARLAVPVVIVSYFFVGLGFFFGLLLVTYLLHQLLSQGWPAPPQIATVFILVGPMCQSAAALQLLGQAAHTRGEFAAYNKGTFLTAEAAMGLEAACVLLALMMTGLGIVWTILAICGMVDMAVQKKLVWTPTWNSIIFPTGTMTTSMLQFSIEMNSPTFRVVTTILIILMILLFLLNLVMTAIRIWQGKLLIVREDPRIKAKMESEQKER